MIILLDSGPIGLLTYTGVRPVPATECDAWVTSQLEAGAQVMIPGIIDYEIRRELIRSRKGKALDRLDELHATLGFIPVDTAVLRLAARLWATARQSGMPTADDRHLDVDVILAAQALTVREQRENETVVVATANVRHLARFVDARHWGSW